MGKPDDNVIPCEDMVLDDVSGGKARPEDYLVEEQINKDGSKDDNNDICPKSPRMRHGFDIVTINGKKARKCRYCGAKYPLIRNNK